MSAPKDIAKVRAMLKAAIQDCLDVYDRLRDGAISWRAIRKAYFAYVWNVVLLSTASMMFIIPSTVTGIVAASTLLIFPVLSVLLSLFSATLAVIGLTPIAFYNVRTLLRQFGSFWRSQSVKALLKRSKTLRKFLDDDDPGKAPSIDKMIDDLKKAKELRKGAGLESDEEISATIRYLKQIQNFMRSGVSMDDLLRIADKTDQSRDALLANVDKTSNKTGGASRGHAHAPKADTVSSALRRIVSNA